MARTYTTNFVLIKPDIGETETEGWGTALNMNFDTLDTQLINASHKVDLNNDWFPFDQCVIRNQEMDNTLSTTDGTEITISAIDTTAHTITLSWLPYKTKIFSPIANQEWALMNLELHDGTADPAIDGNYTDVIRIDSGTYSTRVLNYTFIAGTEASWNVGNKVMLYNPYAMGWDWGNDGNYIISSSGSDWRQLYVNGGPIFRHSNGNYIMLVSGKKTASPQYSIGAFQCTSANWPNVWTVMNSDAPILVAGGTGWRQSSVIVTPCIFKLEGEDRYLVYLYGKNISNHWSIGWAKFDENFGNIEYATSAVMSIIGNESMLYPSVVRYGGKYRMSYVYDPDDTNGSVLDYVLKEAFASRPEGPFTFDHDIFSGGSTNDGEFKSGWMTLGNLLVYCGRLYMLINAGARYKASGNRGKNQIGLAYWDERLSTPTWVYDKKSPIIINPRYAQASPALWSVFTWAADHVASQIFPIIVDDYFYIFLSMNHGADTYKIGYIKKHLT